MPVAVVKLGSSIVAEDNGELRLSVVARITEEVAALHRGGVDVVVVTSGAIAPDVTTTTSTPARCSAATSSVIRATTESRSSPLSSATIDDPSFTTATGMRRTA